MPGIRIHITGVVQGVGMRPFVYREAVARGISGWVLNAGDGVHIEARGAQEALDAFTAALGSDAPVAARVESVEVTPLDEPGDGGAEPSGTFEIAASAGEGARTTLVSPDIATCPDCVRELFDPADRRFHYPFINCTNCGPRFTIIRGLPYDRAKTSMAAFPMCPDCAREYADPADRRFHAQPDACFACGPHLTWRVQKGTGAFRTVGRSREESDAIIDRCVELLAAGGIAAIKGLGGFHLACDAGDEEAVRELRRRKHRSNKPLAVMMRDLNDVREACSVGDAEAALLTGSVRPIVLLGREQGRGGAGITVIAPSVAFDLPELGVMLPYTPLQHLLMTACEARGVRALVMTSGNLSEEPIETDDDLAWKHLVESGIADALLGNDRAILSRYDDSVVRVAAGAPMPVRRARGYAPMPLELPPAAGSRVQNTPVPFCTLACGSEQKATLALTREGDQPGEPAQCFLSQHIGDVENGETFRAWHEARTRMEELFDLHPTALACDLHPSYLPSQWARETAREQGLPLVEVQHHHAHIASVMAEATAAGTLGPDEPVVGIALDGTGAGTDGTVWGGEVLVADLTGFTRAAHLRAWRLPGGAASVRDARRNAFSLLSTCDLLEHPGSAELLDSLDDATRRVTATMIERGINSPLTSSAGRLLDAIAALTDICGQATYEGEPAIRLEAAAWRVGIRSDSESEAKPMARYRLAVEVIDAPDDAPGSETPPDSTTARRRADAGERPAATQRVIDPAPMLAAVLDDLAAGRPAHAIARDVHEALARAFADVAATVAREHGITAAALSGGVFMNRILLARVSELLRAHGIRVLIPHRVPVNDGCIAYGQAAVARARLGA